MDDNPWKDELNLVEQDAVPEETDKLEDLNSEIEEAHEESTEDNKQIPDDEPVEDSDEEEKDQIATPSAKKSQLRPIAISHSRNISHALSLAESLKILPAVSAPPPEGGLIFGLCIVDFNHIRGPEIEYWKDDTTTDENQTDKIKQYTDIWPQLPFQALPDGAHLFEETFSNFTLVFDVKEKTQAILPIEEQVESSNLIPKEVTTLFGCACIRQVAADTLTNIKNPQEIKRSVVQKSVVLITRYPITIQLKEKLSIITASYFNQNDLEDRSIIDALYENISYMYNKNDVSVEDDDMYEFDSSIKRPEPAPGIRIKESDFYIGYNLQSLVLTFKRNLLVLFKSLLLEKRILFYSKDLHKLSNMQYSLLSLIPNLIFHLGDSGFPLSDISPKEIYKPTSLKSSDRNSMLRFLGLPMHIFDKGGFFQPYLALQQMDYLKNPNTKWYMIGVSNQLFLDQKAQLCDILVNIDDGTIELLDLSLKSVLSLTYQDRRFIDLIVNEVEKNSSVVSPDLVLELPNNNAPSETINNNVAMDSKTYSGGDDFIRWSFEDYLVGLLATVKYDSFLNHANPTQLQSVSELYDMHNQVDMFNMKFIEYWKSSNNFKIFDNSSDDELFNFFEPKHQMGADIQTGFVDKLFKWSNEGKSKNKQNNERKTPSPAPIPETSLDSNVTDNEEVNKSSSFAKFFQKKSKQKQKGSEKLGDELEDEEVVVDENDVQNTSITSTGDIESGLRGFKLRPSILSDSDNDHSEGKNSEKPTTINSFFNNAWSSLSKFQKD